MDIPTSADYIDRILKESLSAGRNLRYDSDIAEAFNVSRSTLSQYRKGHNMSVLIAVKVAEILQLNPMETIAATLRHQARTTKDRDFWTERYKKYQEETKKG